MGKADLGILNAAAGEITQQAAGRHFTNDAEAEAAAQLEAQIAEAAAREKHASLEDDDDDFDDFEDDPMLASIQEKRLEEMKKRHATERILQAQGHGEYREIVEEDFLKEVCGSENVVVHFYHNEFIRCKIVDKHMR